MNKEVKKRRREYQRRWQTRRRKALKEQGLKIIRVLVHEDFVDEIKAIAAQDIENRRKL